MKIFIDTANLDDIAEALKRGFADGITTNPKLLSREPKAKFEKHIFKVIDLLGSYGYPNDTPLSVEVFSRNPDEIIRQAFQFKKEFAYPGLVVKVQIGWDELYSIRVLSEAGIAVNCTAGMSILQGIMALEAGARYVSLFWGRIRDGGLPLEKGLSPEEDAKRKWTVEKREEMFQRGEADERDFEPGFVVGSMRRLLDESNLEAEIIVGSIRKVVDIRDAFLAGANIVTIPPNLFPKMCSHFKTEEAIDEFFTAFTKWTS